MERETALAASVSVATGTVPEGWVADFLTGKHVRDTPEEYVRQNLEKALVRQYKFEARDCQPEFPIKVGSARKRVDVVVFPPGAPHPPGERLHSGGDQTYRHVALQQDRGGRPAP